ncbi:hypothetical protein L596_029977 [Steinernema carpocapsae]|uniref:Abnormal cell migration protein 18-like fibronectin type I domain-containing protein n=1 Tax=Steinernema carpocapsae TaxID=34508 RepID=A0A4U5LRD1_STECR|nr:hypothetical protein L596_029977 [Steinernema carpocapsae]
MIPFLWILAALVPAFWALDCKVGDVWVKEFIKFECYANERVKLGVRPIGCVPDDKLEGKVIAAGEEHRNKHFFFRCLQEGDTLAYKIINCVDDNERIVEIGQFFTRVDGDRRVRVECEGNATEAKKTVVQWTSCTLPSGEKLSEGGIHLRYAKNASGPQTAEIFSCKRDGPKVSLKCTGCVTSAGDQVVVSSYAAVDGVQMQCRRFDDGCRLIKIDPKYLDCSLEGNKYPHGSFLNSTDGINYYFCKHGFLEKRGCFVEDQFISIDDLIYVNTKPVFCRREPGVGTFGNYNGCTLKNGSQIKFKDVFEDKLTMKRCLWTYDGREINGTKIEPYACVDKETGRTVLINKFFQNGPLHTVKKCVKKDDGTLELRQPTTEEFLQYANSALSYNLLLSEIAHGGYGNAEWIDHMPNSPFGRGKDDSCFDHIPQCDRLKPLCESSFSKSVQKLRESLKSADVEDVDSVLKDLQSSGSSLCDQKLTSLIEITCPRTCGSCMSKESMEARVDEITRTSRRDQC